MDKFLGKWSQTKAEKLDEYLAAKGVPWLVRKVVATATLHMEISEKPEGFYRLYQWTAVKNMMDITFKLDEELDYTRMDGKQTKTKFMLNDKGHLIQRMVLGGEVEDITREINTEGQVVQTLTDGDIVCKRWFNKD